MSRMVTEIRERRCCQEQDMRPVCDSTRVARERATVWDLVQCRHCGQLHRYRSFLDAAGSHDWEYRPITEKRS